MGKIIVEVEQFVLVREAREYNEFLHHKVESARASMRADLGQSNDEIEAEFAAKRANVEYE